MLGFIALVALQKPLTLPARAMRLDELLKEVSAGSGVTYKASEPMLGRIVIVAGPARPASAVCADLANVLYGRWRQVGTEWILDEDRDAVAAREKNRLAGRVAQVKKQLDDLRNETAKPFDAAAAKALLTTLNDFDEADRKDPNKSYPLRQKVEKATPANLAVRRIASTMDPVELASLTNGTAVFSDYPTRLQRPLNQATVRNAVQQLVNAQRTWATVFTDVDGFKQSHGRSGYMSADPRAYTEIVPAANLRMFLKVQTFDHGQTLFSGMFLDKAGVMHQFGEFSLEFRDGRGRTDPAPKFDPQEPKLTASKESDLAVAARLHPSMNAPGRAIYLHPDRREPLDVIVGDGLRGVAKARNASLVAWLGDRQMLYYIDKKESPSEWLRNIWNSNYEIQEKPGSITLRPRFAADNIDRRRLAALIAIGETKGYLPLDDLADYALPIDTGTREGDMVSLVTFGALYPGLMEASRPDWPSLRLWGGFTRSQRQTLLKSGLVRWSEVPKAQQDRLMARVLQAESYEINPTGPNFVMSNSVLDREPTEILAKGFSFGDGVYGTGRAEEGIFTPSQTDNPYEGGVATASSLAEAVVNRERHPGGDRYDGLPKVLPGEYRFGTILDFGIRLPLTRGYSWQKNDRFGEFDMRRGPVPLESMSDSFRKSYERGLSIARQQPDRP